MSIFRFSAEFCFFFFTFCFFKNDFPLFFFFKSQTIFILCTDTATINCWKSFGKQSVTSWFAGMHFFRFRSKFESGVPPLGSQNLTPAAMLRVGVQRGLPWRGRVGGWSSNSSICTPSLSFLITLHTHTLTFRAASCYDFAIACHVSPCMLHSRQKCYGHLHFGGIPLFFFSGLLLF